MKFKKSISLTLFFMLIAGFLAMGTPVFAASDPANYVFDISEGDITVAAGSGSSINVTYGATPTTTADFANTQNITVTGESTGNKVIVDIAGNTANMIIDDLDIEFNSGDLCAFDIINGTVNLTLTGVNKFKSSGGNPGLRVTDGKTLIVQGTGSLDATGGNYAAGIGGGNSFPCGTITINSGTIKSKGGTYSPGIGGGFFGSGGTIHINGGSVTAIGGASGAGIGGGEWAGGGSVSVSDAATLVAVSDGHKPAIETEDGNLDESSTAYVLLANFATLRSINTATAVYLKSDASLKASYTPDFSYKSIAFTVPSAATYQLKTADKLQIQGSEEDSDFIISNPGFTVFNNVKDCPAFTVTVNKDDTLWGSGTPALKLSSSSESLEDELSGTCTNGVYAFANTTSISTFYVWDTDADCYTGESVTTLNSSATVDYYTVALTVGDGINSISGSGTYLSGTDVFIDATAFDGYFWYKWTNTDDGTLVSRIKNDTIEDISAPQSYTANAKEKRVDGVSWTGMGNYDVTLYEALVDPGFADTTVEISTPRQLAALARAQDIDGVDFSGVTFALTQDIDLSGYLWDPIGLSEGDMLYGAADGDAHPFIGSFEGNGYVIRNMTIDGSYVSAGLFGNIGNLDFDTFEPTDEPYTISNITVEGTVDVTDGESAGGIVGVGGNLILTNCINKTTITASGEHIIGGGVMAFGLLVVLDHCVNKFGADISVIATSEAEAETMVAAGGIVGALFAGSMYNSANGALVTVSAAGEQPAAGGIMGLGLASTIGNCYNTGAITAEGNNSLAGGICGFDMDILETDDPYIQNSYNAGVVTATTAAGIAASVNAVDSCYYLTGTAEYAYYDEDENPVLGTVKTSAEMQSETFLQSLNDWVADNPLSSSFAETTMNLDGVLFQEWLQKTDINHGFPIFFADGEDDHTVITVDDTEYAIGTETISDGITTATVDQSKFAVAIAAAAEGSLAVFPISNNNEVIAELTLKNIEDLAKKKMMLMVQTGNVSYNLNTEAIDIAEITAALGTTDTENILFNVSIANSNAAVNGADVVISPVEFTITCTYQGDTFYVESFDQFVSRSVEVTAEQADQITTAVVVNPDGSLRHVPTKVTVSDDQYEVVFNSMTNSAYALIENPVSFADVTSSWAKDAANDLGSRMIVMGIGDNKFAPNRAITRAEFVTIIVRAFGLEKSDDSSRYSDVKITDWYCGYLETASAYGLIQGFEDGTFGPNERITREQAMMIIANAMKLTKINPDLTDSQINTLLSGYTDSDLASPWAQEGISACVEMEIVFGRTDAKLCPKENLNRAEAAVMVQRLLQKSGLI